MYESLLIFSVSLIILLKASHIALRESLKTAKFLGLREFAIGFLFISFFTSLPELVVSFEAVLAGMGGLAIGNIVGTNISNILLILGLSAVLTTVAVKKRQLLINSEIFLILSIIPVFVLLFGTLTMAHGIVFISLFVVYCIYVIEERVRLERTKAKIKDIVKTFALFFASLIVVVLSAMFVVSSSADIVVSFGISEAFIGITLVAFGTSLPELAIAIMAFRKGRVGLATGCILGSCVVNTTLILGIVGILSPMVVISLVEFGFAIFMCILVSMLLLIIFVKYKELPTIGGALFAAFYILFLFMQFVLESIS